MNIGSLIQKATRIPVEGNANAFVVSNSLLYPIKNLCKSDDEALSNAFHYLSVDLRRKNGCVRMRSLYIINELFQRSKAFRKEISQNIGVIVACSGLLRGVSNELDNSNLAGNYTTEIENKVKELIETWDSAYGALYPEIHAVARYFRETLKLSMPNIAARKRQIEANALAKAEQERNVVLLRSSKLVGEMKDTSLQVANIINRIEECFNILFPRLFKDTTPVEVKSAEPLDDNFDDVDWIASDAPISSATSCGSSNNSSSSSSNIRDSSSSSDTSTVDLEAVGAVPFTISFTLDTTAEDVTTADNEILISIVRELSKQLVNHVVPRLIQWRDALTKGLDVLTSEDYKGGSGDHKRKFGEDPDNQEQETSAALSKTKQLLVQIHTVLMRKCKELLKK